MVTKSETCFRSDEKPLDEYNSKKLAEQSVAEFEADYGRKGVAYPCEGECHKWHVRMGYTMVTECDCGKDGYAYISGVIARKVADKRQKEEKEGDKFLKLRVYKCEGKQWHMTKKNTHKRDDFFDKTDILGGIDVPDGINFPDGIKIPVRPKISTQTTSTKVPVQPRILAASKISDETKISGEIDVDKINLDDIDFVKVAKWGAIIGVIALAARFIIFRR